MDFIQSRTLKALLMQWENGTISREAFVKGVEGMFETAEADSRESLRAQLAKDIPRFIMMEGNGAGGSRGGCTAPLAAA